jgi:hypothetical protein
MLSTGLQGDEEGVPGSSVGLTGSRLTAQSETVAGSGKSKDQRMPPGRGYRPDPEPASVPVVFPPNFYIKQTPKTVG